MAQALLIYYSQSGTTAKIAQYIAAGLSTRSWDVDLCNINEQTCPDIHNYDLIGIGSPVYFFNPVPDMRRFLSRMTDLKNKPIFIFLAYGTNPGGAIDRLRKIILEKGAIDAGSIVCRNANFIFSYPKAEEALALDQVRTEELSAAKDFGKSLADRYQSPQRVDT